MEFFVFIVVALLIAWVAISQFQKSRRRKRLFEKYGSEEVVEKIMAKEVWQGMSAEQLIDSWGDPEDRDQTVFKTKTKETWKYGNNGKNRYRQRVYLEDELVVGWKNQ